MKNTEHKQYTVAPQVPLSDILKRGGATASRARQIVEAADIRSANYSGNTIPTIPYRLTPRGIDIQNLASFLAGSIVTNEVVSGSGTSFTLANTPVAGTLTLFGNGIYLTNTIDYTLSGAAITIIVGTYSAGTVVANYFK